MGLTMQHEKDNFIDKISFKYDSYTKNANLTIERLDDLIIACGYMPTTNLKKLLADIKESPVENDTNITLGEFMKLLKNCHQFKQSKELLKHLMFFTNKQKVLEKEQFEKMIGYDNEYLKEGELQKLYALLGVEKDGKINLEEFVG